MAHVEVKWNPSSGALLIHYANKMPLIICDMLNRLGFVGQAQMKRITSKEASDSGRLYRSITQWQEIGTMNMHVGVTNVRYAPIMLEDTPPFIIRPKNKRALAWVDEGKTRPSDPYGWYMAEIEGFAHFSKKVSHPGGINALERTKGYVEGKIPGVITAILKKYAVTGT